MGVVTEEFYTAEKPAEFEGMKVIDCDTHFIEPPDLWTSRAPAKWLDRVPHIITHNGLEQWALEGTPLGPISLRTVGKGRVKYRGLFAFSDWEQTDEACYDAKARVALMDDMHVWAQIVYPNAAGFGGNTFGATMSPEIRMFCVQAYNDAIAEWQAESGNRLLPQALLPFWDIAASVKELERVRDMGLSGITITTNPQSIPGTPDYGNAAWQPFWELCNELDLPISFHVGSQSGLAGVSKLDTWESIIDSDVDVYNPSTMTDADTLRKVPLRATAAGVPTYTVSAHSFMAQFLMSGLLDRYSKLQFALVESGIGWVPFILEYLDYNVKEMAPDDAFGLQRKPSEAFRDQMHVMWWFERFALRAAVDFIGPQCLLWESDFPHPVCTFPHPLKSAAEALESQPHEIKKMIMQDNAAKLWHIPLD
jgi:predicted TIM-barrel fold metal-dependent hydrolase